MGTPQPLAPRRMYALIALADPPSPKTVSFIEADTDRFLDLSAHNLSDASRWATWLGATETHTAANGSNGYTYFHHSPIVWHGWRVQIHASEHPRGDKALDAATRAELEEIADLTPTSGA